MDDHSSDNSRSIASRLAAVDNRVRVFDPINPPGIAWRLNEALATARGPLFARMDADDVAYPTRLERQVAFLRTSKNVDLVGSPLLVFGRDGVAKGIRTAPLTHDAICARPARGFRVFHPTWMGKTEWFRQFEYRHDAKRCEDQDLLLRSFRSSIFANVPEPLLGYREEDLDHVALRQGRMNYAMAVARQELAGRRPAQAAAAIAEQAAKATVDTIAIRLRLESRLLRHRAEPLPQDSIVEWRQVWFQSTRQAQELRALTARVG
jgi:glycosyltransferase involved in cell wall biosynthesis